MMLLRRRVIFGGLALPFTGLTWSASAQTDGLLISNRRGVTARPSLDQPDVPMLWLSLPGSKRPNVVIEMPEHSWGRPRGTTEQRFFYRMYSNNPALRLPAKWSKQGGALTCSITSPVGVRLQTSVSLDDEGVMIRHTLTNDTDVEYEMVQAPTCIKLYRPFTDVFLERTYVHHKNGMDLLASETPDRLNLNAEEWLPVRYIARSAPPPVPAEQHKERQAEILRYNKLRLLDAPFLATTSAPAGWVVASHTFEAPSVFSNPARTCHHVDPADKLKARGEASLSLKVYVLRGGVEDAWRLVGRNRGERRP